MSIRLNSNETRTIIAGGATFFVAPRSFQAFAQSLGFAREHGGENAEAALILGGGFEVMSRIVAWDGIEDAAGNPAECTEANKLQLFGERPDLLNEIATQLREIEASAEKNSDPSPAG